MIYFVRHAESEANRARIYAGSTIDSHLTGSGAANFRKFSRNNTLIFDKIFVSTLRRSADSGKIFQEEQTYPLTLVKDERLNELDFGRLAGKTYRHFDSPEQYQEFDIEQKHIFYERIKSFYEGIKDKAHSDNIVIVAHAGVGKMLYAIAHQLPYERYNEVPDFNSYELYSLSA